MRSFLDIAHPDWNSTLITTGFEFDPKQLHGKEGFPVVAKSRLQKMMDWQNPKRKRRDTKLLEKWTENATAQEAEYKVVRMLERLLANEVATIISGYKETSLGNIVPAHTPDMPHHSILENNTMIIPMSMSRKRTCGVFSAAVMLLHLRMTSWPGWGLFP